MNTLDEQQSNFFSYLKTVVVDSMAVTALEYKDAAKVCGIRTPWRAIFPYNLDPNESNVGIRTRGVFDCTDYFTAVNGTPVNFKVFEKAPQAPRVNIPREIQQVEEKKALMIEQVEADAVPGYFIPAVNSRFVSFGEMSTVNKIIKSGKFCPTFIFGETGLGKSMSVNQLAAKNRKEVIRINVNAQTCEEDLIGGFRLIGGETVWQDGPLILAMKRGAILLIDEVTALNPAYAFMLFCALEGEPVYIKKINRVVTPQAGFNIIATDNTRGYGTSSGRYVGVNVQNEAFLDRFTIAVEYDYPTPAQELRILKDFGSDENIMMELIKWANFVRNTYKEGAIDVTISPRRIVNIMMINEIFNNLKTSIEYSIKRFEGDIVESLLDFFDKIVSDPEYSSNDDFNEVIQPEIENL